MKKILSKTLFLNITLITVVVYFSFFKDEFHTSKYYIGKFATSLFQKEYDYSAHYQFKVPEDWFFFNNKDGYNIFLGPTWNKEEELTIIKVFTDMENVRHNYQYFSPKYCTEVDEIIDVNNTGIIISNEIKIFKSSAKIIFCKNDENNESFVSYENAGLLTHMVLKPYNSKYRDKYIEIFKNIDYKMSIDEIPEWAK